MTPISLLVACSLLSPDVSSLRIDAEGVGLPPGVVRRIGSTRFRHEGTCGDLHFTADGKRLIGVTNGKSIYVWDTQTGSRLRTITKARYRLSSALRPNDTLVLLQGYNSNELAEYDIATGATLATRPFSNEAELPTLSPDGSQFVATFSGLLISFDTKTMKRVNETRLSIADYNPNQLALSANNKLVVASFMQWTEVRDITNGNLIFSNAVGQNEDVERVAFSPDSQWLIRVVENDQGNEYRVEKIDLKTERIMKIHTVENSVYSLKFAPDSSSIFFQTGPDVIRIDLKTNTVKRFPNIGQGMTALGLSQDGKILAGASDGGPVQLWDAQTGTPLPQSKQDLVVSGMKMEFSPNGTKLTLSGWDGGTVAQLYDLTTEKLAKHVVVPNSHYVRFLPNGDEYVVTSDQKIEVRTTTTDQPTLTFDYNQRRAPNIRLAGNGRYLFADGLDHVHYWDLQTRRKFEPLPSKDLDFLPTPDGQRALRVKMNSTSRTGNDSSWRCDLVDLSTRLPVSNWNFVISRARYVAFEPNGGGFAIFSPRREMAFVDLATGRTRWRYPSPYVSVLSTSFSSDGRNMAVPLNEGRVVVLDTLTGKSRFQLTIEDPSASSTAFTPDGKYLAVSSPSAPVHYYDFRGKLLNLPKQLPPDAVEKLWAELLGEDAAVSFAALRKLAAAPESVIPRIRDRVKPVEPVAASKIKELIAALDAPAFRDREDAMKELKQYADRIASELEEAEQSTTSPEVRQRLERVRASALPGSAESVRQSRIVELLEWCATPDAVKLLEQCATGAKGACLTREATRSLARLKAIPTPGVKP